MKNDIEPENIYTNPNHPYYFSPEQSLFPGGVIIDDMSITAMAGELRWHIDTGMTSYANFTVTTDAD
jgi:hypothetical protein